MWALWLCMSCVRNVPGLLSQMKYFKPTAVQTINQHIFKKVSGYLICSVRKGKRCDRQLKATQRRKAAQHLTLPGEEEHRHLGATSLLDWAMVCFF